MATFFRQIARGERSMWTGVKKKKSSPAPAAPAPAAPAPSKEAQTKAGSPAAQAAASDQPAGKAWRPPVKKKRTVYTGALGISERDKSGIALKTLTGQ